jgi:hypothetical protein
VVEDGVPSAGHEFALQPFRRTAKLPLAGDPDESRSAKNDEFMVVLVDDIHVFSYRVSG